MVHYVKKLDSKLMGLAGKKYRKRAFDVAETVGIDYRLNKKKVLKRFLLSLYEAIARAKL
jgi:hypothetical protein